MALDPSQRIPVYEKVGYSMADAAANFVFMSMILFQAAFYTDVMKIKPGTAALIILVPRLWDAFFDPIMGITADRTHTRWGRFRPWVLWTALPWGIVMWLAYTTPTFQGGALVAYAVLTNTLLMTLYSANNMPYSALGGVMSADLSERAKLNSFRFIAVNAAQFIVQGFTLVWVNKFANGNTAHGWSVVFGGYAVLCVVCFIITFATSKERVKPLAEEKPASAKGQAKSSVKQDFADLLKNGPWAAMFLMMLFHFCILAYRGGAEYQYYQHYADRQAMFNFIKPMGLTARLPMFDKTAVDASGNALDLHGTYGLETGEKVTYKHGFDETQGSGGLKNGTAYFVRVLPDGSAQFFDTEDDAKATGDQGLVKLDQGATPPEGADQKLAKDDKTVSLKSSALDYAKNSVGSLAALDLKTGDKVTFQCQIEIPGLKDGTAYYVNVGSNGKVRLYDTKTEAEAGGTDGLVKIASTGTGAEHEIIPGSILETLGYVVHANPSNVQRSNVANAVYGLIGMIGKAVTIIVIIFSAPLAKRFGKKAICIAGFGLMILNSFAFYIIPKDAIWLMLLLSVTGSIIYAPTIPLVWAMFADVADFGEWKTGRRATGIIFATIGFALKAGLAIGAYGLLEVQAIMHYDPDHVSDAVTQMFRVSTTIVPGVLFAICTVLFMVYKLDKHTTEKIVDELAARKAASAAAPAVA